MSNPEEIWAARLQRELVALSSASSKQDNDDSHNNNPIGALPPFVQMKDYKLEIEHGFCQVSFIITVDANKASVVPTNENESTSKTNIADRNLDQVRHGDDSNVVQVSTSTENKESNDHNITEHEHEKDEKESNETRQQQQENQDDAFKVQVLITLDASLKRNIVDFHPSTSYPFQPPICIINSGAEYLPKDHHSIQNGEEVQLDCDWTPSLHLNDAALNVAVKVRESIKRGEPILEYTPKVVNSLTSPLTNSLLDEVSQDFNKASHAISGFFADLKTKASHVADELDQAVIGSTTNDIVSTEERTKKGFKFRSKGTKQRKEEEPMKITEENVQMGDSIDLAEAPWNHALGMYPCKAIRRPNFMSTAMKVAGDDDLESSKVRNNYITTISNSSLTRNDCDPHIYGDCVIPDNYLHLHAGGLREVCIENYTHCKNIYLLCDMNESVPLTHLLITLCSSIHYIFIGNCRWTQWSRFNL